VAKLANAADSKSVGLITLEGSIPSVPTIQIGCRTIVRYLMKQYKINSHSDYHLYDTLCKDCNVVRLEFKCKTGWNRLRVKDRAEFLAILDKWNLEKNGYVYSEEVSNG
jgi:hypothetical protein